MTYDEQIKYSGNWENGQPNGDGVLTRRNENSFTAIEAVWKDGKAKFSLEKLGIEGILLSKDAVDLKPSEDMPFSNNPFLCYYEDAAYKVGCNPQEQYFDAEEQHRCLVFVDDDGIRNGPGIYCWPDGARYQGMFKEDKLHGQGRLKNAEGRTFEGIFKNNELVTQLKAIEKEFKF